MGNGENMAIQVKDAASIAAKWSNRAGAASGDYSSGVTSTTKSWSSATQAAAGSYQAGVNAAISNKSFEKGVAKAGDEKWRRKASSVGSQRYAGGVSAAKDDFANGVSPYLSVIAGLTLPPKGAKGDPANNQRSVIVQTALRKKKLGQS